MATALMLTPAGHLRLSAAPDAEPLPTSGVEGVEREHPGDGQGAPARFAQSTSSFLSSAVSFASGCRGR